MFSEEYQIRHQTNKGDPFMKFEIELLALFENTQCVLPEHILSVVRDKAELQHFVFGLEESETKSKLTKILDYNDTYYGLLVARLLPFLKSYIDRKTHA
ncbi:MAG: hypothetical protein ACI9JN_002676 [Bacteroidia bacterium]|jgi:hypothetical protein